MGYNDVNVHFTVDWGHSAFLSCLSCVCARGCLFSSYLTDTVQSKEGAKWSRLGRGCVSHLLKAAKASVVALMLHIKHIFYVMWLWTWCLVSMTDPLCLNWAVIYYAFFAVCIFLVTVLICLYVWMLVCLSASINLLLPKQTFLHPCLCFSQLSYAFASHVSWTLLCFRSACFPFFVSIFFQSVWSLSAWET